MAIISITCAINSSMAIVLVSILIISSLCALSTYGSGII